MGGGGFMAEDDLLFGYIINLFLISVNDFALLASEHYDFPGFQILLQYD